MPGNSREILTWSGQASGRSEDRSVKPVRFGLVGLEKVVGSQVLFSDQS